MECTKEKSKMVKKMDQAQWYGIMVIYMMVNGRMINEMVMESSVLLMIKYLTNIKDNSKMIK